jgi:hypothetical protein
VRLRLRQLGIHGSSIALALVGTGACGDGSSAASHASETAHGDTPVAGMSSAPAGSHSTPVSGQSSPEVAAGSSADTASNAGGTPAAVGGRGEPGTAGTIAPSEAGHAAMGGAGAPAASLVTGTLPTDRGLAAWRLAGDETQQRRYVGTDCELCKPDSGWTIKQKDLL